MMMMGSHERVAPRVDSRGDRSEGDGKGGPGSQVSRGCREAVRQWRRYRLALKWIIGDAARRYKKRMILVSGAGIAGAAAQGAAFGLALGYANALEVGRTFSLGGISAAPRQDLWLLYAVGGGVTLSLFAGVGLLYYFQRGAVRLGKNYEAFCVRRTLALASHLPHPNAGTANERLESRYLERILNDARLCGRVLRLLTNSVLAFVVAPAALVIMFVLNPFLSIIILVLALGGGASLYRVNVKSARASKKMEQLAPEASRQRRNAVDRALQSTVPISDQDPELMQLTSEGPSRRRLDAYADRLEAVEESGLVTGALAAAALGAILIVEGRVILQGSGSVSLLVAYVAVLRLFITNFMKLGRNVSSVSRFYPQIRRHFEFTDDAFPARTETVSRASFPIILHARCLEEGRAGEGNTELGEGSSIGVVVPERVDRVLLSKLSTCISRTDLDEGDVKVRLATAQTFTRGNIADTFGFPSAVGDPRGTVKMGNSLFEVVEHALNEAGGLWASKGEAVSELDGVQRFAFSFLASVLSCPHLIVVRNQEWSTMPQRVKENLQDLASNSVVAYVGESRDDEFPGGADARVLVVGEEGVVGWCSQQWLRNNRGLVKDLFKTSSKQRRRGRDSVMEDDDENE